MKSELRLRDWRRTDVGRLAHLGTRLSPETDHSRFWGGVNGVPPTYLRSIEKRFPFDWDAVVAVRDGQFVGWAEYGRNPHDRSDADLAVCVVDSERGRGTGGALMRAIVAKAAGAGLTTINVDLAGDNTPAMRSWLSASRGMSATMGYGPDGIRATVTVDQAARRAA